MHTGKAETLHGCLVVLRDYRTVYYGVWETFSGDIRRAHRLLYVIIRPLFITRISVHVIPYSTVLRMYTEVR